MDIEPHHVTTVSRRFLTPPKERGRTLAEYQADIRARFGGTLPPWEELAKHESPHMRMREYTRPEDNEATRAAIAAVVAKGVATRVSILEVLTEPMTCVDISKALKRTRQLINRHLILLAEQGKVTREKVKGVKIWQRVQEAAE